MKRKFFVVNIYKMVCVWVCVKGCQNFLHVSKRSFTIKEIQLARHKMVVQSSKIIYSFFPWSSIYSDIVDSVMKSYLIMIIKNLFFEGIVSITFFFTISIMYNLVLINYRFSHQNDRLGLFAFVMFPRFKGKITFRCRTRCQTCIDHKFI